jgi:two-component system, NtrC family, response regulator HydG
MSARKLKILVVDDDVDNAHSMAELFELEGHSVKIAESGEAAIAAYLSEDFDIAFMDVMMPGKNGVESFIEIRKMRPSARVVMMTGYSVEELLRQAVERGAMGVLLKPMEPRQILNLLDEVGASGVVVAPTSNPRGGEEIQRLLAKAGRASRLISEASEVQSQPPRDADGVLILDFDTRLIDGFHTVRDVRSSGCQSPAIVMAKTADPAVLDPAEVLRDFQVTGVLNKPFDPLQLIEKLGNLQG